MYTYTCISICIYIWILAPNDTFYHQHLFKIHYEYNSRIIHGSSAKFASVMKWHRNVIISSAVILLLITVSRSTFFSHLLLTDCRDSVSLFLPVTRIHNKFHSLQIAMQNSPYLLQRD